MDFKMPVKNIMSRNFVAADIRSDVRRLTQKMLDSDIGTVVITDKKRPVGIVTRRDIFEKIVSKNLRPTDVSIEKLMTTPLVTTTTKESFEDAILKMVKTGIRRLPVMENEKLVGIVELGSGRLPGVPRRYPGSSGGQ